MRLRQYITESAFDDNLVELVRNECSQWLEEMKGRKVWRATSKNVSNVTKFFPRKDRRPLDTPKEVHDWFDNEFKKKFGWKARSQGVFAASSPDISGAFGENHVMFPCNGYKYLYNDEVDDLTVRLRQENILEYENYKYRTDVNWDDETKRKYITKKIIDGYTDKGLYKQQTSTEVIFDCPKGYYLFDSKWWRDNYDEIMEGYIH